MKKNFNFVKTELAIIKIVCFKNVLIYVYISLVFR